MTIYAMGSHPTDFNNTGVLTSASNSNDAYSDPGYNRYSVNNAAPLLGGMTQSFPLGGLADVWAGFTMGNIVGSASEGSTATIFELRTSGAQGIVRLQNTSGPTRTFQYWNGSAWTNIGTLSASSTRMGRRIDIRCKIASSGGEFSIYVDRVLQQTLTGNTNFFSATIDGFSISNWGQFNGRTVTEIIIADEDTRKIRVMSGFPTGNSATNTAWTGAFSNLNVNPSANYTTVDGKGAVSSAGSQAMSYTKQALGNFGDDGAILAVQVSARAKNDGSSADFDLMVRSGGSNYTASHGRTINTTNTNGYAAIWNTDPATGVAWTKSGVDNAEIGMVSKNAGVSTINMLSYNVAIRDDFLDVWESSYPSTSGMAIVTATCPASVGYADITVPAMVTAGCTPTLAVVITEGQAAGAVRSGARVGIGFCANETKRPDYAAKASFQYLSTDASNSSSTQRGTQNRTLKDFAQVNGGWLVDSSGLRVRFEKFIKGGMRIYYETVNSGAGMSFMFCWGSNLKTQLWSLNLGTVTTAQAITGIGFKPDGGLFLSAGNTISQTTTAYLSIGMAADDGAGLQQRTLMRYSASALAPGPAPIQMIDNTAIGGLLTSAGAVQWDLTLNSFDTDGFTVQASASAASATLMSILFKDITGKKMKILDYSTPTSTGSQAHNGAGFTPKAAFGVSSSMQALNTISNDVEPASSFGFWMTDPASVVGSVGMSEQSTSDPSVCKDYLDYSNPVRIGTDNGTMNAVVASLTGYNSDGLTLSYTAAAATSKLGFMMVFEGSAGGPPAGVGRSGGNIIICM